MEDAERAAAELRFMQLFREWLHRPIGVQWIKDRLKRRQEEE